MYGAGVAGVRMPEPIRVRERTSARDSARSSEADSSEPAVSPNAYLPTTGDVKSMQFRWTRACGVYKLLDNMVVHRGDGVLPYRPVIGDLAMTPGSGKYYYEIRVNTDNCRIGLCTANAYPNDKSLELYALGEGVAADTLGIHGNHNNSNNNKFASSSSGNNGSIGNNSSNNNKATTSNNNNSSSSSHRAGMGAASSSSSSPLLPHAAAAASNAATTTTSAAAGVSGGRGGGGAVGQLSYLETIGAVPLPDRPLVVYLDVQTSRVYVNGVERKHLWRLFVPAAGCLFGFVVDMDEGVVQLFVDKKYAGLVFDVHAGLKGATLYPCVGFAGFDMNNANIGRGICSATISPPQRFSGVY